MFWHLFDLKWDILPATKINVRIIVTNAQASPPPSSSVRLPSYCINPPRRIVSIWDGDIIAIGYIRSLPYRCSPQFLQQLGPSVFNCELLSARLCGGRHIKHMDILQKVTLHTLWLNGNLLRRGGSVRARGGLEFKWRIKASAADRKWQLFVPK